MADETPTPSTTASSTPLTSATTIVATTATPTILAPIPAALAAPVASFPSIGPSSADGSKAALMGELGGALFEALQEGDNGPNRRVFEQALNPHKKLAPLVPQPELDYFNPGRVQARENALAATNADRATRNEPALSVDPKDAIIQLKRFGKIQSIDPQTHTPTGQELALTAADKQAIYDQAGKDLHEARVRYQAIPEQQRTDQDKQEVDFFRGLTMTFAPPLKAVDPNDIPHAKWEGKAPISVLDAQLGSGIGGGAVIQPPQTYRPTPQATPAPTPQQERPQPTQEKPGQENPGMGWNNGPNDPLSQTPSNPEHDKLMQLAALERGKIPGMEYSNMSKQQEHPANGHVSTEVAAARPRSTETSLNIPT